ncbi:MAG TPA: hypothetical protein VG537_01380 [Candidatus Kapabacteria bacterium]|jgi:hypothetical protein|nr:hypothetical protein [Candidatus Kapabacteria bacterium]
MDAPVLRAQLRADYERFALGMPTELEAYILDRYQISLASEYAGLPIKNPFGKASGQLSLTARQIERDAEAGLGFAVLKTVIAQDELGAQSMKAWAIPATHMTVEEIVGTRPDVLGERGWTVTWKGRGWSESFEAYLDLFNASLTIGAEHNMLVVPSVKYHLPKPGESIWKTSEYEFTTAKLLEVWHRSQEGRMPLEKDFSPTLAGDLNFSRERETILNWLRHVPKIIRETSAADNILLGLKLFNAAHSDDFQLEMLETCETAESKADYIIYGNRLFDPTRSYEGVQGVAYGGPDLSSRNLDVLAQWKRSMPLSATGNITTGRIAFEYLKCGATSFQMHTLFQLPDYEFDMKSGTRTQRAMHRLLFHPEHGFLAVLIEANEQFRWPDGATIPEIHNCLMSNS